MRQHCSKFSILPSHLEILLRGQICAGGVERGASCEMLPKSTCITDCGAVSELSGSRKEDPSAAQFG